MRQTRLNFMIEYWSSARCGESDNGGGARRRLAQGVNTFLLVLAAIFPIVNPPGTALVFVAFTKGASAEPRTSLIDQTFYPLPLPLTTGLGP